MENTLAYKAARLAAGLALAAGSATLAQAAIYIDPGLTGTVATAEWESGSLASGSTGAPTASTGFVGDSANIDPIAPGYRATAGFYSFMGDFGAILTGETAFEAKTVVVQLVMMQNPDFSIAEILGFEGGATLSFNGGEQNLVADFASAVSGPVAGSGGGMEGDYYSFAWQWDLSSISGPITDFEITIPIIVHSSTIEARLDISDTFTQVIPEPSHYAVAFGAVIAGIALIRRRKQCAA